MDKYRWFVLAVISIALFSVAIDMTVLYVALPVLTHELQASTSEKLWIINIYPLVVAGLLLGAGTLGDRIGHKRLFTGGLIIFGGASLLAAFSPTSAILIFARGLMGVGAAAMMPATLSIIRLSFEDENERSLAIGIWSAVASGGAAVGPLLGGVLLDYFWWGSVFLINVPIVLLASLLSGWLIINLKGDSSRRWDLIASLQSTAVLISLAYAICEFAKPAPSYTDIILTLVIAIFFSMLFVRRQCSSEFPLIDGRIFRNPTFSYAVLVRLVVSGCLMGINLALSQRLQLVLDLSPLRAGLYFLPQSLGAMMGGSLSGWLLPHFRRDRLLAFLLTAYAMSIALYLFSLRYSMPLQVLCLSLLGGWIGSSMTVASNTIMSAAPPERAGMAASIEGISYELGGGIGIAVMGSLMSVVYRKTLFLPNEFVNAELAQEGIDSAILMSEQLPEGVGNSLLINARLAFENSVFSVMTAAVVLLLAMAVWIRFNTVRDTPHSVGE